VGDLELTIEELAAYNGKDGNSAYIAIDGLIYDVTKVSRWTNGMHRGFEAGQEYTEELNKAPHGMEKLSVAPIVGKIVE